VHLPEAAVAALTSEARAETVALGVVGAHPHTIPAVVVPVLALQGKALAGGHRVSALMTARAAVAEPQWPVKQVRPAVVAVTVLHLRLPVHPYLEQGAAAPAR